LILEAFLQPSGSQEKFVREWIEFDCQNGVHHGKLATYKDGKRIRKEGGYIGRFDKVQASGSYGTARVKEFTEQNHHCHYPERFKKDLDECGIANVTIQA
jgi:hypothetical protein